MKHRHIVVVMASALLTFGLASPASAQDSVRSMPEGIEVITVVGKRPTQEGIEVITVVGKRPAPTVTSTCVNAVVGRVRGNRDANDYADAQAFESRYANRDSVRKSIKDCIEQAQLEMSHS